MMVIFADSLTAPENHPEEDIRRILTSQLASEDGRTSKLMSTQWYLLLGATSSASGMLNLLIVQSPLFMCCKSIVSCHHLFHQELVELTLDRPLADVLNPSWDSSRCSYNGSSSPSCQLEYNQSSLS